MSKGRRRCFCNLSNPSLWCCAGLLSWISIGRGSSWDVCKLEATPVLWVPKIAIHSPTTDHWSTLHTYTVQLDEFWFVCFSVSVLTFLWQIGFFNQHGCTASAANAKYNSRASQLYREKIKTLATQATRRHGTEVKKTPACSSTDWHIPWAESLNTTLLSCSTDLLISLV